MTRFTVPDMSCGHCTAAITKGIKAADAAAEVTCDLPGRTVEITSTLSADALAEVLRAAGYAATPA